MAAVKHVLDGYKILDFTQVLAGPTATRMMTEMGVQIIREKLGGSGNTCNRFANKPRS
jgi:crotonobetainyl-CoA:carnitine CoA-transferase CaiB-like acyl-CoA transferase